MLKISPITASNIQIKTRNKSNKNDAVPNTVPSFKGLSFEDIFKIYRKDIVHERVNIILQNAMDMSKRLGKYVVPSHAKTTYSHELCYYNNKATYPTLMQLYPCSSSWAQTMGRSKTMIPWKIHIYADTEEDWQKLVATVGKYLNAQPVDWKTLAVHRSVDSLNASEMQKGKAFTIYPSNQEQFKQLAHDIDYIIRINRMEIEDTNIKGDRQLGNTGRIFYRYEHQSGATKDRVYDSNNQSDWNEYKSQYDPNRGADQYLAYDMTIEDDPFYRFDPREPLS